MDRDVTAAAHGASPALRAQDEERPVFVFPVPIGNFIAKLQLPQGLTHEEASKIARVLLSLADQPRGLSASEQSSNCEAVTPISPDPTTGGKENS